MPTRQAMWDALDGRFDLLVVGAGITGAGIARDAARRGLRVACVDMDDVAFGTSSRSSKLIHGGLRYLEQYEFSLVFESVSERRILQDMAPHLVNPLGFLFPVYKGARKPLWMINTGIRLYEGLSLFRSPKRPRSLKPAEVAEVEPAVRRGDLKGAPLYYDCATDDARLTLETALDAVENGAVVATWAKVTGFLRDEHGRIAGARVEDRLDGTVREVAARAVVNATGPWTDATVAMSDAEARPLLRPTKGVHVVVARDVLPLSNAVVCFHPSDKRVLFAIPWGDRTYVGTTDTDFEGDPADVAATSEDVDYLIDAANSYFPQHQLTRAHVISTWAGIRPLMAPPDANGELSESKVSREHAIVVGADGLVTIAGGKLTTYRRMAAEVVDTAVRLLELTDGAMELEPARTDKAPLPGARGWPADDDHARVAEEVEKAGHPHVPSDVARYLADTYGMRALELAHLVAKDRALRARLVEGRPEILAVVDWSVQEELAATVCDLMVRRTQLFYRDLDQGLGALPAVASRMAKLLGWDGAREAREIERYRAVVAASRAWRGADEATPAADARA
ncbi:MAG: glycerol-3-phosphate dehydrogenase [Sandaracinaceae bacterium]|nr:glycerol-3-phosphate dehydrogenase [Sandaracinaceae bacterium]